MRNTVFRTSQGRIERSENPPTAPGEDEVSVRICAVALNFRDVYFVRGNEFRQPIDGRIPLTDAVGIVAHTGRAVSRFGVGDRVCTTVLPGWLDGPLTAASFANAPGSATRDGVLASSITLHEDALVAAPAYLSDREAATLPVAALTAWHAIVELGALKAGDTVLIQSTGGVAVFAIQFAAALGAKVIVVSRSAAKLAQTVALGATHLINSQDTPDWDRHVLALTDGIGAQLVLDMGLADSLRQSVRAAACEATVAIIGVVQQTSNLLDIYPVMNKNLRVRGVETGSRAMFERMNRFMALHRIHPVIDSTFHIDSSAGTQAVEQALERMTQSPFGKVVLTLPC